MKRHSRLWAAGALALAGLSISACTPRQTTTTTSAPTTTTTTAPPPPPTTTNPPTTTTAPYVPSGVTYKNSAQSVSICQLFNDPPDTYQGQAVHFTGTLLSFVQDGSTTTAINVMDPTDKTCLVYADFSNSWRTIPDPLQMGRRDTVEIWADDMGSFTGLNAFGRMVTEAAVTVSYLLDQSNGYESQ